MSFEVQNFNIYIYIKLNLVIYFMYRILNFYIIVFSILLSKNKF
jgi:hypothetical protein